MKTLLMTALLLILSAVSVGQSADQVTAKKELPDMPKAQVDCHNLKGKNLDRCLQQKYPDRWGLEKPVGSFKEAASTGAMPYFIAGLAASFIYDEEGTQHCISNGTCTEHNPILGQTRTQAYLVGGALTTIAAVAAIKLRQEGHGNFAAFILWGGIVGHVMFGTDGWRQ